MPDKRISDEITVVAGLAAGVSNYARSRGIDIIPICTSLDIDPATFNSLTERISLDRFCRLLETCALIAGDDTFGLQCAATFPAGASGAFGYGLMSAPTVRAFLRFLQDHVYYATNNSNFTMVTDAKQATLSWTFAPVIAKREQYVDFVLGILMQRLRDILGDRTNQVDIGLERPKPSNLQLFKERMSTRVSFSQPIHTMRFPAPLLDAVNPNADARLFELMNLQCRMLRPETSSDATQFIDQVKRYMQMRLSDAELSLGEIAPYFNLSERSFQRRLAELGTNLNEIKDAIRKNAGFKLLVESDLPVSDIGYRLGYSTPGAFSRSVSRWFGATPTDIRRKHTRLPNV
ncbi:AraC family transcriptional regulator [uncultured Agrobacterium sp.]|uniref:AraC family transcriptional regulator n=1 Tax=uncultured Agrobacterium sp. TaxID=157277 RepID=UPI0025CEFA12|nr:AraC family transcriptional regulator [uncultured Agrobacterium sp.]